MTRDEIIGRCYSFIRDLGIEIEERIIEGNTFVPGIAISQGRLVVDKDKMKYPGDLLHEAGHIALTEPGRRVNLNGDATDGTEGTKGYELGVLIWSFLAAREARIPDDVVFHQDGYKGDSEWLLENFRSKKYIGLPLLQWMGIVEVSDSKELKIVRWMRL